MNDNTVSPNPQEDIPSPFAGREDALAKLHHFLASSARSSAFTFLGRRRIGKTSLLQHFAQDESSTFIAVYFPLKDILLRNEQHWLRALSQSLLDTLNTHGYVIDDSNEPPYDDAKLSIWFSEECLPKVFSTIRHQCQLVLLIDDVDAFLRAATALDEQFQSSVDILDYLHYLLHPQLSIVVTIDLSYENELGKFRQLVNREHLYRLSRLSPDETAKAINQYIFKQLHADAVTTIYRETGGEPAFIHHFGNILAGVTEDVVITEEYVKRILPDAYSACKQDVIPIATSITHNEPWVLNGISNLLYSHPLRPVDTLSLERWLVQTDRPLDTTTINSAFRSLEYADLVKGTTSDMQIAAGVIHKWTLEMYRPNQSQIIELPTEEPPISRRAIVVVLLVIILVVLSIISLSGTTNNATTNTPIPTAPLSTEK